MKINKTNKNKMKLRFSNKKVNETSKTKQSDS